MCHRLESHNALMTQSLTIFIMVFFNLLKAGLQPLSAVGREQPAGGPRLLCLYPKGGVASVASHLHPTTHTHTAAGGCYGHKHPECRVPGKASVCHC